jgi:nucleotide-binding universal stress UspA family protein
MNQQVVEQAKDAAEEYLRKTAERMAEQGVQPTTHVVVDHQAGHAIVQEAQNLEADLVVMATHGRGGLQRAILGSTTDKVIRSVHVPVLVRRPE